MLAGVEVPPDKVVMHMCNQPSCVNPRHLRVGTQLENIRQASAQGRMVGNHTWGESSAVTTLSMKAVNEMRALYAEGWSRASLARRFDVNWTTASNIVNEKTWVDHRARRQNHHP